MIPSAEDDQEQPFISHLVELRTRILRMVVGVLIVFAVLAPFSNFLYEVIANPLIKELKEMGHQMIATDPISPFLTPIKLSLMLSLFVAMPWVLYQLWAFVAPGLYRNEKRLAVPMVVSSTILFYTGMAFAYFVVLPLFSAFITATAPEGVAVMTDINLFLNFLLVLFFAFGIAFEIPIATIILIMVGITTPDSLVSKRPYIIVGAFVVGMLLTPPDVISQTLLALPMWILFEVGVLLSRFMQRRQQEAAAYHPPADPEMRIGFDEGLSGKGKDERK